MRKLLLLLAILFLPSLAHGQGYLETGIALNQHGRPIPSPTVTVCTSAATSGTGLPCTPLTTVYSDIGLTIPVANPLPICATIFQVACADTIGNFSFYIAPGTYKYTISGQGTTLQGPFVITVPCVTGSSCGGGGGGGGTVGPGTAPFLSRFTGANSVGNSSCSDDSINPTYCPDGFDSGTGGFYARWTVDTGGVVQGNLVCRSNVNKVVICPAGTTTGVIGSAYSTVVAGGVVAVCMMGKCPVVVNNATTTGDWLIPSVSVAGKADDFGATKPTTGTQTFQSESTVAANASIQTTLLSLDSVLAATGGGSGTINPCTQYGIADYIAAGTSTTLSCFLPSVPLNGAVFIPTWQTTGAQVAPVAAQSGLPPRIFSGTSDTIGCADRAPGAVYYRNSSAATALVPDVGSTCFSSSPAFKVVLDKATAAVTFNRTSTSSFNVCPGGTACTAGATSFTLQPGQYATFTTPDAVNWTVTTTSLQTGTLGPPTPIWKSVLGVITVPDSDQGYRDANGSVAGSFTLGTPNSVGVNPITAIRIAAGNISSTPFTTAAFPQAVGHQLVVAVINDSGTAQPVNGVSDFAADGFTKLCESIADNVHSVSLWLAPSIAANGSNTVTVNWSSAPGRSQIYVMELQGAVLDTPTCTVGSFATAAIHFSNAVAVAVGFDGVPPSWSNFGAVNGSEIDTQLQHNVSQVTYGVAGANPNAGIAVVSFSISSTPTFVAGWTVTLEDTAASAGNQLVVPTASLVNGQSTQTLVPNEWCDEMSNGTSYNARCGFIPNFQVNGVIGSLIEVGSRISNNISADIGATAVFGTGTSDASYTINASLTCRTAVAGQPTLTITWTDTSNTVQTVATAGVDCTALGAASTGSIMRAIRAKASTNINVTTTHAGAQPTYDVDVSILQRHTL